MWTTRRWLNILALAALLCLSFVSVGICSESRTYTISETELMTLENHLSMLEQNNETLKTILSESGEELTKALDALILSQKELETLRSELLTCKSEAENAKKSLQIANDELAKASQSFKAYEAARDKTENRLRNQRNIWEVLFFLAAGVAVAR